VPGLNGAAGANRVVYANVKGPGEFARSIALIALDARTGRTLWKRPDRGGLLAADADGVVVAHLDRVARFDRSGKPLWTTPTSPGAFHRILETNRYVVALSVRAGMMVNGEIDSIDRRTGRLIGTTPWFGRLLALRPQSVLGESDFPGEVSTMCGDASIMDVDLSASETAGAPSMHELRLSTTQTDYLLESFAQWTPPPTSSPVRDEWPCSGARSMVHPNVLVDGDRVVLSSGPVLGLFDRTRPNAPFGFYRDATLVGGPSPSISLSRRRTA